MRTSVPLAAIDRYYYTIELKLKVRTHPVADASSLPKAKGERRDQNEMPITNHYVRTQITV